MNLLATASKKSLPPRRHNGRHAVITNSTYDGLLYNTDWIKQTLDVPSIRFRF
ncbi:hypothetical protein ACNKHM_06535 [Shigella sonnei]